MQRSECDKSVRFARMLNADSPIASVRFAAEATDLAGVHERVFDAMLAQRRDHTIGREALSDAIERDGGRRRSQMNPVARDFDRSPIDAGTRNGNLRVGRQAAFASDTPRTIPTTVAR